MNGPLPLLAGLLLASCATSTRIPFGTGRGWHAYAVGGDWGVNKSFAQPDVAFGMDVVLDHPGTGGWGYEAGVRYAQGVEDGIPEHEIEFYELAFGVRQTYRPEAAIRPHVGAGVSLMQARTRVETPTLEGLDTNDDRGEFRPGLYLRSGLAWHVLRDPFGTDLELPLALDVRGMLGIDYSFVEVTLGIGIGR